MIASLSSQHTERLRAHCSTLNSPGYFGSLKTQELARGICQEVETGDKFSALARGLMLEMAAELGRAQDSMSWRPPWLRTVLELLNEPSFLQYVGDRGVRTLDDAREYVLAGPVDSYDRHGFGLYLTALKEHGVPIGICGLLKRESLEDVDIGFAFLPKYCSQGYALESASAVMDYGRSALGLRRIVAVTAPANDASIRVLEKLGMRFERMVTLAEDGPESKLFAV